MLFEDRTLTVNRYRRGKYTAGRWEKGTPVVFTINGTTQPYNGRDLETLLQGKRVHGVALLISDTQLQVADPITEKCGDGVFVDGTDKPEWEILQAQPWRHELIPHYEYLVIRLKEGD